MAFLRLAMAVAVAVVMVVGSAVAQQGVPSCASKLVPCAQYLNATSPPESCCGPLREAVRDEKQCLCALFNDKALMQAFKIDLNQALLMAKHCGIAADASICSKTGSTGNSTSSSGGAAPSASSNTTVPPTSKSDVSAVSITTLGTSGLVSSLLLWFSVMA